MNDASDCRWVDVSPDYRGRLQRFDCATPVDGFSPTAVRKHGRWYEPWELEVQTCVRDFRKCTEIDPRNEASKELFSRLGFIDMGTDPAATEYHRWVRAGFDGLD